MKRRNFIRNVTLSGAALVVPTKVPTTDSTCNDQLGQRNFTEGEVVRTETVIDPETFMPVSRKWIRDKYGMQAVVEGL